MRRRLVLQWAAGGIVGTCFVSACHDEPDRDDDGDGHGDAADAGDTPDGGAPDTPDACVDDTVLLHDTHAQALYLDGSYGPLTGNIKVDYILAGTTLTLDFWHGHGGVSHRFTLDAATFAKLKAHERVYVTTTTVDGHQHTLFIDPTDEAYRVDGAPDVPVPLGNC